VAILIALDIQFMYYGTEARPYSLVQLLSAVQVFLFWQWIECNYDSNESASKHHSWGPSLRLTIASALLIYAHYTSVWLLVSEAIFIGIWMSCDGKIRRRLWRSSLSSTAMVVLFCIPAFLMMNSVFARRGNWAPVSSIHGVLSEFFGLNMNQASPLVCWIVFPTIVLCFAGLTHRILKKNLNSEPDHGSFQNLKYCFVVLWATIPVIGVIAFDYFKIAPTALTRYTLVGSVAFPVFAGLAVGFCRDRKIQMGLGIILIAASLIQSPITSSNFISSGFQSSELPGLRFEDWQTPIAFINSDDSKRSQPVFLASNLIEDVDAFTNRSSDFQAYLLFPLNGIHQINSDPEEGNAGKLISVPTMAPEHFQEQHIQMMKRKGGAWILIRGTEDLAFEFEAEIRGKSKQLFPNDNLNSNLHGSPYSYVYILSVDW